MSFHFAICEKQCFFDGEKNCFALFFGYLLFEETLLEKSRHFLFMQQSYAKVTDWKFL